MEEVKKKKSWYKKWWVWVIIVLVIGVIGNMNTGEEKTDTAQKVDVQEETKDVVVEPTKEEPKEEPKKETDNRTITAVGEGIETKNFKISVLSLDKPTSDNQFLVAEEGNEFVSVGLLIENLSDKDYTVSSMIMFNAYQDGFSINEALTAHVIKGQEKTMDGALAAGKKIKGSLMYEMPKDWKELEIDIDLTVLSFSNDGKVKIVLQNK